MRRFYFPLLFLLLFSQVSCETPEESYGNSIALTSEEVEENEETDNNSTPESRNFKILALGDSYTIGESVCDSCKFPEQLKDSLKGYANANDTFQLDVIAQTGWTTNDLLQGIEEANLQKDYDLATLLIGVNNQYQGIPFALYQSQFPQLVDQAVQLAKSKAQNVILISIPDYAFTPFGLIFDDGTISSEIDAYNAFAKNYAIDNDLTLVNITDITRMGLEHPELVASDGLHPSELAYSKFVERILPFALEKLEIED